jgi:hypothetical protein
MLISGGLIKPVIDAVENAGEKSIDYQSKCCKTVAELSLICGVNQLSGSSNITRSSTPGSQSNQSISSSIHLASHEPFSFLRFSK